jgi:hypothetical protein
MNPVVKNVIVLLAFILFVGHMAKAQATMINFPPEVQCMIKYRTKCIVC